MSNVAAAGSLSYDGIASSLWIHNDVSSGRKYSITDFKVLSPAAAGNLDFVGPGEIKAGGKMDYVGQFTIRNEDITTAPPDWLLWIHTAAQMKIGPNDEDGRWKQS